MRTFIFFKLIDVTSLLYVTLASRELKTAYRLRECAEEHVKWLESYLKHH